jgi:hypothetical protein
MWFKNGEKFCYSNLWLWLWDDFGIVWLTNVKAGQTLCAYSYTNRYCIFSFYKLQLEELYSRFVRIVIGRLYDGP